MRLKYYLRGLGIGMVVTALLMGFTTKGNEISDEEIKARALELGMVEQKTLADIRDNGSQALIEATQQPIVEPQDTTLEEKGQEVREGVVIDKPQETELPTGQQPTSTEEPEATEKPQSTEKPEATETPKTTDTPADVSVEAGEIKEVSQAPIAEVQGDIVQVTIFEGNNSSTVCRILEETGLVESATAFDRYLIQKGYSKIINTGTYKIAIGTSEANIAKIITNTN